MRRCLRRLLTRRRLLLLPTFALAAIMGGTLLTAVPAWAGVAGCNSNDPLGARIYYVIHNGLQRNIYAKVCTVYNDNRLWNDTVIRCRTNSGGGCGIRAEVLYARENQYTEDYEFVRILAEDWFHPPSTVTGYYDIWAWDGTVAVLSRPPCSGGRYAARDHYIRVRFGFDPSHLRDVGSVLGPAAILTNC